MERKSSLKEGQISVETIEKAKALAELEKAKMKADQEKTTNENDNGEDKNEKDDDTSGPRRKLQRRTQRDDTKVRIQVIPTLIVRILLKSRFNKYRIKKWTRKNKLEKIL